MIHRLKWDSVLLEIGGDRVEVKPLPLGSRRRFVDLQAFIAEIIQANPDLSIGYLYDHDGDFAWAAKESLALFGLPIEQLSAGQLNQLLFAYDGGAGALWQLEFPDPGAGKGGKLLDPDIDPYHAAIAALWSYTPDRTLAEVTEILGEISYQDLQGIMEQRNRITIEANPELQKKDLERQQMERVRAELENLEGDFFAGLDPFNSAVEL